jgi:hypothetical protein
MAPLSGSKRSPPISCGFSPASCPGAVAAPAQRADARLQLVEVEGLGQVVVGAGVQAHDAVADRAARREQQHGRAQPFGAGLGQHLQAVEVGQAQVQRHHVGLDGAPLGHGLGAVAAHAHVDPAPPEGALQGDLHRGVVFDQQQLHTGPGAVRRGGTSVFSPVWRTAN